MGSIAEAIAVANPAIIPSPYGGDNGIHRRGGRRRQPRNNSLPLWGRVRVGAGAFILSLGPFILSLSKDEWPRPRVEGISHRGDVTGIIDTPQSRWYSRGRLMV